MRRRSAACRTFAGRTHGRLQAPALQPRPDLPLLRPCWVTAACVLKPSPRLSFPPSPLNRHGGSLPAVHANDVFFAIHAAVVTAVTLFQCAMYDRGGQRISWLAGLGTAGSVAGIAAYLAAVVWAQQGSSGGGGHVPPGHTGLTLVPSLWFSGSSHGSLGGGALPCGDLLSWLSFLYFLSYIKLAVSLVKYIPQVCALCVLWLPSWN